MKIVINLSNRCTHGILLWKWDSTSKGLFSFIYKVKLKIKVIFGHLGYKNICTLRTKLSVSVCIAKTCVGIDVIQKRSFSAVKKQD